MVEQALTLWSAPEANWTIVRQRPNVVVEVGSRGYLRMVPESRRAVQQVEAEIAFVEFLAKGGASVARAIASSTGKLVAVIGSFSATLFERARGEEIRWGTDSENQRILERVGEAMGKIHALSRSFPDSERRFSFDEDTGMRTIPGRLPDFEEDVKRAASEVFEFLDALPRDSKTFGMIHGDFVPANLRVDGERVTAFDFDDCCRHFYLFDIAVALRPASRLGEARRRAYCDSLLAGYSRACDLPGDARMQLTHFWRVACLWRYVHALRNWDLVNLNLSQIAELKDRREAVVQPVQW